MASFLGFQNDHRSMQLNERGGLVKYAGFNGNALLYAVVATATTGFSLFGYDQGLMSGIIGARQFNNEFPATKQPCDTCNDVHTGTVRGSVTACYEVGCFFGAMFAFFVGEKLGRRKMSQLGGIVMIIGTIITVTAFGPGEPRGNVGGFVQFIIGRVITGLGNGANTATLPSWVAECAKPHNRGFLICVEASTVAVGTVIAYWIDFGLSFVDSSVSWRFPIAMQILFAIIMMCGVAVLPESPRWLMKHGYHAEAARVVAGLAGTSVDDPVAVAQRNLMSDAIAAQARVKASAKDLLKQGKQQNMRRALVGASTQLFQQLGGCNAVIYYSTILFEENIGLDTQLSLILGGVLSVVYAIFALSSFFLVEKVGRRKLFLIGTFGQGGAMFITFACLKAGGDENAKGAAAGVVQVLPTMTASIDSYTFLLFAIANMLFLPIIYVFYPETAGRTLEELDVIFAHAHLTKRRPTIIAEELPKLTDYQVATMTDRYDIHGGAADAEADGTYGAAVNAGEPDTTLPPANGDFNKEGTIGTADSTRTPSPTGANTAAGALNEKPRQ